MLDFHSILWFIPGVLFIHIYNLKKPHEIIRLSGWPYISFLVIMGALTWLPAEHFASKKSMVLPMALVFTLGWLILAQFKPIASRIFVRVSDNFYKKCIEWSNKEVLLTLKNGKAYMGILWNHSENPSEKYEFQVISIAPFMSGYREKETKKIIWNTYYPEYENESDFVDMEILIPRNEIVTIGKFNKKVFDYFEQKNKSCSSYSEDKFA